MSPFQGCLHLLPIPIGLTAYAIKSYPYRVYKKRLWQTVHPQAPTGRNCIRISPVQILHRFKNEFIFAI